jgi:antitoxin (DNA-binding transcriptional repressor) of toxin-antitoxin stability system
MNASVLDLRRNMKDVIAALDRNESVTLTYRGRRKASIVPCEREHARTKVSEHSAFGIWADRKDMQDVASYVKNLRKGRF